MIQTKLLVFPGWWISRVVLHGPGALWLRGEYLGSSAPFSVTYGADVLTHAVADEWTTLKERN
jgi:hypothetical protein